MNIWLTADTHFMHTNIIEYESRPFKNVAEMNEKLISNWNETVKEDDIIWHLGDVTLGKKEDHEPLIQLLKGRKSLILGNHDKKGKTRWRELGFEEVVKEKILNKLWMTHWYQPNEIVQTRIDAGEIIGNVHGHVHSKIAGLDQRVYKCVSVELTNYKPIAIEDVIAHFKRA